MGTEAETSRERIRTGRPRPLRMTFALDEDAYDLAAASSAAPAVSAPRAVMPGLVVDAGGGPSDRGVRPREAPTSRYCASNNRFTGLSPSADRPSSHVSALIIVRETSSSVASTALRSLRAPTALSPATRRRRARRVLRSTCACATL